MFGGLRKCDEHLTDFFSYAVDTDEVEIICAGTDGPVSTLATLLPAVGHTQRASIDVDRGEIHVMTVRLIDFLLSGEYRVISVYIHPLCVD